MSFINNLKTYLKKFRFIETIWHKYQSFTFFIKHPVLKINKKNREGVVVQLVSTFITNDAICNACIEISNKLSELNKDNYILYEGTHSYIKNGIPVKNFRFNKNDIVIYHMSKGCDLSNIYAKINVKRKILYYHNITPAKFFSDNLRLKKETELGREQLAKLKEYTDIAICDSKYNEGELIELGYKKTKVIQIPNKINDLMKYKVKREIQNVKNIITVGRIARHKCIDQVIKVFNEYYKINKQSHLYIVGRFDNKKYEKELKDLITKCNLNSKVSFLGSLDVKELSYYYCNSDVYLCMSEHEGFCVPIIEALSFGLKVIAKKNTALIDTVGEYGLLTDSNDCKTIALLIDDNSKVLKPYKYNEVKINIDWVYN